jgi:hypothetical protein
MTVQGGDTRGRTGLLRCWLLDLSAAGRVPAMPALAMRPPGGVLRSLNLRAMSALHAFGSLALHV